MTNLEPMHNKKTIDKLFTVNKTSTIIKLITNRKLVIIHKTFRLTKVITSRMNMFRNKIMDHRRMKIFRFKMIT